jgi:hypothetical protein
MRVQDFLHGSSGRQAGCRRRSEESYRRIFSFAFACEEGFCGVSAKSFYVFKLGDARESVGWEFGILAWEVVESGQDGGCGWWEF